MKGQFYIITLVFVAASLIILLMFTQFAEFGPLSVKNPKLGFENVQNSISQRNTWLTTYWFDLDWKTKTTIEISGGYINPVEVDADITTGCDSVRVFQKSSNSLTEIASNVTAIGCNVTFNAPSAGIYDIFWNGTNMGKSNSDGNEITPVSKTVVQVPQEGVCNHFSSTLPKKDVLFQCSATPGTNTYNYSINYRSTDFTFSGNLSSGAVV